MNQKPDLEEHNTSGEATIKAKRVRQLINVSNN